MANGPNKSQSHPVWVGSLAESVTDSILMSHFKKFGPVRNVVVVRDPATGKSKQFAYVNYHNHEVAEVAAQEMNGAVICKRKIRTKGPKKLHHTTSPPVSPVGLTDIRSLTDCYFFNLRGECTPKVGQICQFRHKEKARLSNVVCEKWATKTCANKKCCKQHPGPKPENISSTKARTEVPLTRCKSHNAFKCFGQCGKVECNTHFQNEQDLLEHIVKCKELFSPCSVCNAVFFDREEKLNHSHDKANSKKKKRLLSTSGFSHPSQNHSEPIGVFWDIENCRVPKGKSAIAVVNKIREKFYPGRREVEFMCVCDTTKEKKETLEELNKAQINIVHINATSKNAADDKLKQALRRFAQAHMPPATIVLVSGDINFASELSDLRHRHNLRVILLHNQQASDALLHCAHECENFNLFTNGLPASTSVNLIEASNEILITNLPSGSKHSVHKIKGRLNTLASNTGGKVISISSFDESSKENVAVMRFPDVDSARRGIQRLDKENVYGSVINVTFYNIKKKTIDKKQTNYSNLAKLGSKSTPNLAKDNPAGYQRVHSLNFSSDEKLKKNNSGKFKLIENEEFMNNNKSILPLMGENFPNGILSPKLLSQPLSNVTNPILMPGLPMYPAHWSQVGNNSTQNTISNNSIVGVDILVTNLDDTKEMKKKLCSLVREHSKIVSVNWVGQSNENNFHAFLKVPKFQDAQICIAKLNNQIFFNRRIQVSLVSANTLLKMKSEVSAILLDMYSGWLPMNDFLSTFKNRYQHAFHVPNFDQMKDIVYVDGCPGYQFVCLLHFPVGILKVKQGNEFDKEITDILRMHNRRIPFASIPGLYWSYLRKPIPLDENGEVLVKVVLNKQVCLLGNTPSQQAIFYKKIKDKETIFPLEDFRHDIINLLRISPGFSVPLLKFIRLYHQFFGRQCCASDFGCSDLTELFNAFPDMIEITLLADQKYITFTQQFRQQMLANDLEMLLQAREKHKLTLNSLIPSYYRFFGHRLYYRNYGFPSLPALVNSLGMQFKVSGTGDGKVLSLHQQKLNRKGKYLKDFANEVASLIKNQPDKQLGLHNLSSEYHKCYGKQLKLAELGFSKLSDLVAAISDFVEICGSRDQKTLYISDSHPNFEALWLEVEGLLSSQSQEKAILLLQLPDIYKEKKMKVFPLDSVQMNQFLKKIPPSVLSIGKGAHTIIIENNREKYSQKLLGDQMLHILYATHHMKSSLSNICETLLAKNIHVTSSEIQTEAASNEHFQFTKDRFVQLMPSSARKMLEWHISLILAEKEDFQMELKHLPNDFLKRFSRVLRLADYGISKLNVLFEKLTPGIVEVKIVAGQHWISLGPLGKLHTECRAVLEDNDGSLLLCNFAPEYQRKYNKHLKAATYSFAKIGDLIESLSGALKLYGEKNMKVVVLKDRVLNPKNDEEVESCTQSVEDSDSESDDVIIESEEFEKDAVPAKENVERQISPDSEDLLQFFADDDDGKLTGENLLEWRMEPVPDLPQPALEPELSENVPVDLITFTEFDDVDLLNGGLDEVTVSTAKSLSNPFSSFENTASESCSDRFVDTMFSEDLPLASFDQQTPDLMRLLLGRCSPVTPNYPLPSPLVTEVRSTTNEASDISSTSETYSCFPALENKERKNAGCGSYSAALNDIFSNELHDSKPTRSVRPKIAANFSKN